MSRSKFWCFTINNPYVEKDRLLLPQWEGMLYRVHQLEKGKEGTSHYQGFVIFEKRITLPSLKKLPGGERAHWERMLGTPEQARDYCMKEDTRQEGPWEAGDWKEISKIVGKGKRSDLLLIQEKIDEGQPLHEIYQEHFSTCASFFKFFERYKFLKEFEEAQKEREIKVILYWGVAGSGKTYSAFKNNPGCYILRKGNGANLWFPGYTGQKTIIFDDFDGSWMGISTLLRLLDVYPLHVEDKGSSTPAQWTKVIITSNQPIEDWYPEAYQKCPERLEAVKRRIHEIKFFDKKWEPGPLDKFTESRNLCHVAQVEGNTIPPLVPGKNHTFLPENKYFTTNSLNLNFPVDENSQWTNLLKNFKLSIPLDLDKPDEPPANEKPQSGTDSPII